MKLAPLPDSIDPWRLATSGKEISGDLAVISLKRLSDLTANDNGMIHVDFHAVKDEQNRVFIRGKIEAELDLICQLCLNAMHQQLNMEIDWLIVHSDQQQLEELENYDPVVVEEDRFNIKDLIEDELILNLPIAPSHNLDEGCQKHGSFSGESRNIKVETDTVQPFKDLKSMLSENSDNN